MLKRNGESPFFFAKYRKISNKRPYSNKCPSPYLDSEIDNFLDIFFFSKILASNKRPLENNGGKQSYILFLHNSVRGIHN